jgi:hypothetical protein
MVPIPCLCHNGPLAPSQTTIFSAFNGSLALARAPRPRAKVLNKGRAANLIQLRRLVGGQNERQAIETFANTRLQLESRDEDIVQRAIDDDLDDSKDDYIPVHKRYTYSRA